MKIKRSGILLALVAALAFAAGSAVVAYADQAASQIYACVNNSSGTIHITDAAATCASNEVKLVWNTQGPQGVKGDTGPQGPQGIQGPQGQRGPSDGWANRRGFTSDTPIILGSENPMMTLQTLPAGQFLLSGYVDVVNTSSSSATGYCFLNGFNRNAVYYDVPPGGRVNLPLDASTSAGAPWSYGIYCLGYTGSAAVESGFASAVQVETLHAEAH